METILRIIAIWDEEANVWVAESDDVPGLAAEADSIPTLIAKLQVLVPEMLEENGHLQNDLAEIPFEVVPASIKASASVHAH